MAIKLKETLYLLFCSHTHPCAKIRFLKAFLTSFMSKSWLLWLMELERWRQGISKQMLGIHFTKKNFSKTIFKLIPNNIFSIRNRVKNEIFFNNSHSYFANKKKIVGKFKSTLNFHLESFKSKNIRQEMRRYFGKLFSSHIYINFKNQRLSEKCTFLDDYRMHVW